MIRQTWMVLACALCGVQLCPGTEPLVNNVSTRPRVVPTYMQLANANVQMNAEIERLRAEIADLQRQLSGQTDTNENLQRRLDELTSAYEALQRSLGQNTDTVQSMLERVAQLVQVLTSALPLTKVGAGSGNVRKGRSRLPIYKVTSPKKLPLPYQELPKNDGSTHPERPMSDASGSNKLSSPVTPRRSFSVHSSGKNSPSAKSNVSSKTTSGVGRGPETSTKKRVIKYPPTKQDPNKNLNNRPRFGVYGNAPRTVRPPRRSASAVASNTPKYGPQKQLRNGENIPPQMKQKQNTTQNVDSESNQTVTLKKRNPVRGASVSRVVSNSDSNREVKSTTSPLQQRRGTQNAAGTSNQTTPNNRRHPLHRSKSVTRYVPGNEPSPRNERLKNRPGFSTYTGADQKKIVTNKRGVIQQNTYNAKINAENRGEQFSPTFHRRERMLPSSSISKKGE